MNEPETTIGIRNASRESLLARNNDKLVVTKDKAHEYRWARKAANGKIIAISGEGYKNWQDAFDICQSLFPNFPIMVDISGTVEKVD